MTTVQERPMDLMNLIDIQVLMVNSDRDSRELYTLPLEKCGANITTVSSIQDAVRILDLYKPALILCKMGCSTESIEPLIQQISHPKQTTGNRMSLLVTSTCADTSASQELPVMINAYLSNPVAIDPIMYDVWKLIRQSESLSPLSRDAQITRKQLSLTLH